MVVVYAAVQGKKVYIIGGLVMLLIKYCILSVILALQTIEVISVISAAQSQRLQVFPMIGVSYLLQLGVLHIINIYIYMAT